MISNMKLLFLSHEHDFGYIYRETVLLLERLENLLNLGVYFISCSEKSKMKIKPFFVFLLRQELKEC